MPISTHTPAPASFTVDTLTWEVFSALSMKAKISALDALFTSVHSPYFKTCYKRAIEKSAIDALWIAKEYVKEYNRLRRISKLREAAREKSPFAVNPGGLNQKHRTAIALHDAVLAMWREAIR